MLQTLTGHAAEAASLAFSADGKRLVTTAVIAGQPSESIVWDLAVTPPRMQEMLLQADVTAALFDKPADRLLLGDRRCGKTLPVAVRSLPRRQRATDPRVGVSLEWSDAVYCGTGRIAARLRHRERAADISTSHGAAITALTVSPNEQVLATAGENA